jgi:uncharacterized protein YbjT (DUF2867 family)
VTTPVLLTGGTGTLGRLVAARLRDAGRDVRVLTRKQGQAGEPGHLGENLVTGDLTTGDGVAAAVRGVDTIVHCAGTTTGDEAKTRTLVDAATSAGRRPHLVFISVVGADRVPVTGRVDRAAFGYYASKRGAEEVVAGSGLPWTTLRATQFHDLALVFARGLARLPLVPVPAGMRIQPVDADEVAARLVGHAMDDPAGLVPDLGGPEVMDLADLVRGYLRAAGRRRPLVRVPVPGGAARALRAGANLTAPEHATGIRTWADFLAERLPRPAAVPGSTAPTGGHRLGT